MKWVELNSVIKERKGFITISDDKEYDLCRVQTNRKGVVLREKKIGALIRTKSQKVCKANDFIVAEMDAKVGGYGFIPDYLSDAIVSSHYFLFEVDFTKIRKEYFEALLLTDIIQDQIKAKGSTNYSAIRPNDVLKWRIPLFSIKEQEDIENKFLSIKETSELLLKENEIQNRFLIMLRQSIIQEAIQGKLTESWRKENKKVEPASELLKRIKTEKEKTEKKGKNVALPEIKEEEIPFELPTNWVWTILDVVTEFKNGKAHEQFIDPNGDYVLINSKFVSTNGEVKKHTNKLLLPMYKNEIAIVMSDVPNGRALSRCFLIDEDNKYSLNQRIGGLTTLEGIDPKYLTLVLDRNPHYLGFNDGKKQTNLTKNEIMTCPIPLPPLSEQQAIVAQVEYLLGKCDLLQTEIEHLNTHSKTLLKALFNETFATE